MSIRRIIAIAILAVPSVWAQTSLSVPSTANVPCDGPNCATNSPAMQQMPPRDVRLASQRDSSQSGGMVYQNDNGAMPDSVMGPLRYGQPLDFNLQYPPALPPPEPQTEFQKFVYSSTGQQLSIYGHNLFEDVPSTFAPIDRIPVPADYTIGPGDELLIRAWGQIDLNARVVVDRNGQIYLPKVGSVNVAGIQYQQLNGYLKSTIGRVFKNFDLNVNLGQLRSIQVFVVGQARRPGTYTVSSLSSLVNALFASGGPAANGSMRDVQVKRGDKVVTDFDVYDLLVNGDKSKDVQLLPGDVIYIRPVQNMVALVGDVNLPAIYEEKDGSTVRDLIETAGGLSSTADHSRAILERIDAQGTRNVEEFALDDAGMNRELKNGDVLHIFPISPRFENAVTLRGNVAVPGRYTWRQGMRVRDLIPTRDSIITRDYWMRQNALARADFDWTKKRPNNGGIYNTQGSANEYPNGTMYPTDTRSRLGQQSDAYLNQGLLDPYAQTDQESQPGTWTQNSGTYGRSSRSQGSRQDYSQQLKTDIKQGGAEINWDYAVIQRLNHQDLTSQLVPFNLGRAIDDANSPDNIPLQPGDVITIFSQKDLVVPIDQQTKFVWIEGEVKAAGVYRVEKGENLRDVVERAGGLTPNAYLFASEFLRESTRVEQQKEIDRMVDEMDKQLRSRAASLSSLSGQEEIAAAKAQIDADRSVLDKLRETRATGRIVLELKPDDNNVAALPPLPLEDGDRLTIPSKPATVQVVGAVYNQNSFVYKPGESLHLYLNQAGGATRDADKSRMFVIRADGSVVSSQMHRAIWAGNFSSLRLMPGDTIVMPQKIRTTSVLRGLRDWTAVFSQFALGAAAIQVIRQ